MELEYLSNEDTLTMEVKNKISRAGIDLNLWLETWQFAKKHLVSGRNRNNFDIRHTLSAIIWGLDLSQKHNQLINGGNIQGEKVDPVLISLALTLHDIGYDGLFDSNDLTIEEIGTEKTMHMTNGAKFAKGFLVNIFKLTDDQKQRITHLVLVHDNSDLKDPDELIVMQADGMAAIDIRRVDSSFDLKSATTHVVQTLTDPESRYQRCLPHLNKDGVYRIMLEEYFHKSMMGVDYLGPK